MQPHIPRHQREAVNSLSMQSHFERTTTNIKSTILEIGLQLPERWVTPHLYLQWHVKVLENSCTCCLLEWQSLTLWLSVEDCQHTQTAKRHLFGMVHTCNFTTNVYRIQQLPPHSSNQTVEGFLHPFQTPFPEESKQQQCGAIQWMPQCTSSLWCDWRHLCYHGSQDTSPAIPSSRQPIT